MLRPWYKSEKVQVVPCLCFIRKSFHWISRLYTNPLYSKLYRNCDLLELYTSLGFLEDYDLGRHPLYFLRCLCLCFWPPSCQNVTFYSFCRPFLFLLPPLSKKRNQSLGDKEASKATDVLTLGTPFGILSSGSRHSLSYQVIKERQMPNGLENARNWYQRKLQN